MKDLVINKIKELIQKTPGRWFTQGIHNGLPINKVRLDTLTDEELVNVLERVAMHAAR